MSTLSSASYRRFLSAIVFAATLGALFVPPVLAQSKPFRLSGVISDVEKSPLEGVRVELVDAATQRSLSVTTDAKGRFELKVPAGQYRPRVSISELEISWEEVLDVVAGTSMTLDLDLYVTRPVTTPFCFTAACVDRLPGIEAPHDPTSGLPNQNVADR